MKNQLMKDIYDKEEIYQAQEEKLTPEQIKELKKIKNHKLKLEVYESMMHQDYEIFPEKE